MASKIELKKHFRMSETDKRQKTRKNIDRNRAQVRFNCAVHQFKPAAQSFKNGEIHDWYRLVLGYSDHLVADLLKEFKVKIGANVIDPFCGSGTTIVECLKQGVNAWGLDANPSSCFAAKVKTSWDVNLGLLRKKLPVVIKAGRQLSRNSKRLRTDPTYVYMRNSGMIKRGWITRPSLYQAVALKRAIVAQITNRKVRELMLLAATNELVHTSANVRFGPEIYVKRNSGGGDIFSAFKAKVESMVADLKLSKACPLAEATIIRGDSRNCSRQWITNSPSEGFDALISSPPYPTEHDYTRNARLELAFLESVSDQESLRCIKRTMVRSHTKGIYVTDKDEDELKGIKNLARLAVKIDKIGDTKNYGFARLYGKVLKEYFGGSS